MSGISILIYLGLAAAGSFFFIFVIGYKYFLNLGGMNKRMVFRGTLAMSLSLALFLLFVFLFPAQKGSALFPELAGAKVQSRMYWDEQRNNPFPAPSRKTTADLSHMPLEPAVFLRPYLLLIASLLEGALLVLLFILVILSRELPEAEKAEDTRRHIFEYTNILDTLNKTK